MSAVQRWRGDRPAHRGAVVNFIERFWAKVDRTSNPNGCWEWTGWAEDGYGRMKISKAGERDRYIRAHRLSAAIHFGMFDQRLMVCHHCDNRKCVNPAHLYLGDVHTNMRDRMERSAHPNGSKTHCPREHEYTPENTYRNSRGSRGCRACRRDAARSRKQARRALRAAA